MQEKALKSALLSLGLSEHESLVYLELTKLGAVTAGPIIANTGLHRNVVYTALRHLGQRRYVIESKIKGKKQFTIADPNIVKQEFSQKAELATEVASELERITTRPVQEITIHEGNEAYLSLLASLIRQLPHGGTSYILGTGGEEFMELTMRKLWRRYHKVVKERGIIIKMISYESHRKMLEKDLKGQDMYEIRYLPDEIENPSGVRVYPEAGVIVNAIYSTSEQPITAIRIKNMDLVQGQLNLFNNLWKMGKK